MQETAKALRNIIEPLIEDFYNQVAEQKTPDFANYLQLFHVQQIIEECQNKLNLTDERPQPMRRLRI